MSDAEHLIENALNARHRSFMHGTDFFKDMESNPMLMEQAKSCGVSLEVLADMADYVYFTLLDDKEKRESCFEFAT